MVSTCFQINAGIEEIELLDEAMACFDALCSNRLAPSERVDTKLPPVAGRGRLSGLRTALQAHFTHPLGLALQRVDNGAVISSEGAVNLAAFAELIRAILPSILPLQITWSSNSGNLVPGSLYAGWIVIHPEETISGEVNLACQAEIARMANIQPATPLQRKGAEGYGEFDDNFMLTAIDECRGPILEYLKSPDHGDTLAAFVYAELGDAGDDPEEGARMMRSASENLAAVADFLEIN